MPSSPMVETAYRNDEPILEMRLGALLAKRAEAGDEIGAILRVRDRRRARVLAGRVGLAGAVVTTLLAAAEGVGLFHGYDAPTGFVTLALLGSIALSVVVYGIAVADPRGRIEHDLARLLGAEGRLRDDVDRLSSDRDLWALREETAALEASSVWLPLGAASLLAPLGVHFMVGLFISLLGSNAGYARAFDVWIIASIVLVGLAHVSVLYRAAGLARVLGRTRDADVPEEARRYGWGTLGWATLYACLPGAVAWLIPVVIAFVTGVVVVPLFFTRAGRVVALERAHLGLAPPTA